MPPSKRRSRRTCASALSPLQTLSLKVEPGTSRVGGGAAPDAEVKTWVIAVTSKTGSAETILTALRRNRPPVIARISEDRVLLDLRTIASEEERAVEQALEALD